MIGNPDIENQLDTEEALEKSKKPRMIAAPLKNDIGEQNSFVNVIIHLLHYTTEIPEFLQKRRLRPRWQSAYRNRTRCLQGPVVDGICDAGDRKQFIRKQVPTLSPQAWGIAGRTRKTSFGKVT